MHMTYLLTLTALLTSSIWMLCGAIHSDLTSFINLGSRKTLTPYQSRSETMIQGLLKNGLSPDIIDKYFRPELNFETRKTQILVNNSSHCYNRAFFLRSKNIKSIEGIVWPNDMEELFLSGNEIETLTQSDVNALPISLKYLHLRGNKLTTLDGISFNDRIEWLTLCNNRINSFETVHFPKNLRHLDLSKMNLSYKALASVKWDSFTKLRMLDIYKNDAIYEGQCLLKLPESLRSLRIDWKTLKGIIEQEEKTKLSKLYELIVYGGNQDENEAQIKQYFSTLRNAYIHWSK